MPRPREFDTDTTIAAIRDAFWRHGYEATTLQDLAAASGVRAGSLHAAFGSKQALFAAAFGLYERHFIACLQIEARGFEAIRGYLHTLLDAVLTDGEKKGCLIVNAALEGGLHTPEMRARVAERLKDLESSFRDRLAEEGVVDEDRVAGLFGAAVSILALARTDVPPTTLRSIVAAAELLLRNN